MQMDSVLTKIKRTIRTNCLGKPIWSIDPHQTKFYDFIPTSILESLLIQCHVTDLSIDIPLLYDSYTLSKIVSWPGSVVNIMSLTCPRSLQSRNYPGSECLANGRSDSVAMLTT